MLGSSLELKFHHHNKQKSRDYEQNYARDFAHAFADVTGNSKENYAIFIFVFVVVFSQKIFRVYFTSFSFFYCSSVIVTVAIAAWNAQARVCWFPVVTMAWLDA